MRLVFVFDPREDSGTLLPFRVPTFLARILCHCLPRFDYWPTAEVLPPRRYTDS